MRAGNMTHDRRFGAGSRRPRGGVSGGVLWIALAALVVLLIGGCGDSDSAAGDNTTTTRAIAPANASAEAVDVSETDEPECSAAALLAAADREIAGGVDGSVTSFACTPASLGDLYGGYAWALVEAPGVDPLNVFYTAYEDEAPDGGHVFGDWWVLSYGSDVFCDGDETGIPAEACNLLGDSPRRTDTPAPDAASDEAAPADVSETGEPECSAEALLAAADSGVGGVDGTVTSFACTTASLGDLVGGYAWALVEAPGVDPLNVFYTAYEDEAPDGGHVFGDWWVLSYGSDVFCDGDEIGIPAEACDLLGDAPRRTDTPTPDEAATADVSETDEPECSAEALLAAADSGVGSPGADAAAIHDPDRSVASFACTAASLGDLVGGYAWARVEAGSLDPLVIFYSADGGAAYGEWEVLSWGMDATCDEDGGVPVEACDFLTGVPRG